MEHFATALLAFGIMAAALPAARAETTCPPNLLNTTVNGNLIVPAGATCTLFDVTVTGNVQVLQGATLRIGNVPEGSTIQGNVSIGTGASLGVAVTGPPPAAISTIGGNIVALQCAGVNLANINVGGNVQIQGCTGETNGYNSGPTEIAGNFVCDNNAVCSALDGDVKGNVQINDNSSAAVENNTIGGNLQCHGNTSISAASNTVGGNTGGQCAL